MKIIAAFVKFLLQAKPLGKKFKIFSFGFFGHSFTLLSEDFTYFSKIFLFFIHVTHLMNIQFFGVRLLTCAS